MVNIENIFLKNDSDTGQENKVTGKKCGRNKLILEQKLIKKNMKKYFIILKIYSNKYLTVLQFLKGIFNHLYFLIFSCILA